MIMATFAKQTFNASIYASFRPTYPRQLFDFVFRFHEHGPFSLPGHRGTRAGVSASVPPCRWDLAVDLGCGTGQATTELTPFRRVIGVDPSQNMIDGARKHVTSLGLGTGLNAESPSSKDYNQFNFVKSQAENLGFLNDGSVDLVVAAQAAHWFDWTRMWPEAARVLRSGGTAAFWIYSEFRLSQYPSLTTVINDYAQGTDPKNSLGPHWQRPGRTVLENHLVEVPEPQHVLGSHQSGFSKLHRIYFSGDHYPLLEPRLPVIMHKRVTWDGLLSYLRTWSSLHTFHERYPEDLVKSDREGDIAVRFWKQLREGVRTEQGKHEEARKGQVENKGEADKKVDDTEAEEIDIEWPIAMILVKKL